MHFLAFLFFTGLLGASLLMMRSLLIESGDKIGAALAGEYHLVSARTAPAYMPRRRALRPAARFTPTRHRIAA